LRGAGSVNAHHDLLQIIHAIEFPENPPQRGRAEFVDVAWEHESDRHVLDKTPELVLEPLHAWISEPVECGHSACLKEIGHWF
jgi:hypothetical protein